MKTIILTLTVLASAFIGTISNAYGKDNFYKNKEMNEAGQIAKTTIYTGDDNKHLNPFKQVENKYDNNGNLKERTLSTWDAAQSKWVAGIKYQYDYSSEGQLQMLSYTTFNQSTKEWGDEIKYAMYIYNPDGSLLTINYLNIEHKGYETLASYFR